MLGKASQLAGIGMDIGDFAASFNPLFNAGMLVTGQKASGRKAGFWDKVGAALSLVPGEAIHAVANAKLGTLGAVVPGKSPKQRNLKISDAIGDSSNLLPRQPRLSDPSPNALGSRRLAPIREAYEEIKLGRGTPRIDPATGRQKVFQANEPKQGGGRNRWQGALEWDVPGTSHRILEWPDGVRNRP